MRPCNLSFIFYYYFHSHSNFLVGMVIRCFLVFSYIWATFFFVSMVCLFISMSISQLHSLVKICVGGTIIDVGIYLVSLCCIEVNCALIIFL